MRKQRQTAHETIYAALSIGLVDLKYT